MGERAFGREREERRGEKGGEKIHNYVEPDRKLHTNIDKHDYAQNDIK